MSELVIRVGDVVRIKKLAYSGLLEVTSVDDMAVDGRIPYASTYEPGGQYEGSYRGRQHAWRDQVVEIVRPQSTDSEES